MPAHPVQWWAEFATWRMAPPSLRETRRAIASGGPPPGVGEPANLPFKPPNPQRLGGRGQEEQTKSGQPSLQSAPRA